MAARGRSLQCLSARRTFPKYTTPSCSLKKMSATQKLRFSFLVLVYVLGTCHVPPQIRSKKNKTFTQTHTHNLSPTCLAFWRLRGPRPRNWLLVGTIMDRNVQWALQKISCNGQQMANALWKTSSISAKLSFFLLAFFFFNHLMEQVCWTFSLSLRHSHGSSSITFLFWGLTLGHQTKGGIFLNVPFWLCFVLGQIPVKSVTH